MLFTNVDNNTKFEGEFTAQLRTSSELQIATGYFGAPQLTKLKSRLVSLSRRGECKILIGMIFHSGVTEKQNTSLIDLDTALRDINPLNGVFISRKSYHGKIYSFKGGNGDSLYLGSSNFSSEGFNSRWECTTKIIDENTIKETKKYLEFLFKADTTVKLSEVDLRRHRVADTPLNLLEHYEINSDVFPNETDVIGKCNIELRVDSQPASSLNLYFDNGRKNQDGKYSPRPWYEIEITSTSIERESPFYPKSTPVIKNGVETKSRNGTFQVFIKDNDKYYSFEMKVSSENGKALFSSNNSGGRQTLGRYIKGKLESSGALKLHERITSETLDIYGKASISLKKIADEKYILEF